MDSNHTRELDAPITVRELADLLERFASAPTVMDVNIEAGIALNKMLGIDD
jgi:hypothetical protein